MAASLMIWIACLVTATEASPCKDTHHCSDCDGETGYCLTECDTGYWGLSCKSSCSKNCRNNTCVISRHGSANCTDGCVPGYQGINCNIPCDSPGGNCTACPGGCDGGYCQLGSFCVSGCVDSHYGTDCKNCSTGCTPCNRLAGTCEETSASPCKETHHCSDCDGETGYCRTECDTGYYGLSCKPTCSKNCRNNTCVVSSHGSANCTDGCVPGYQGINCNIPCDSPGGNCTACPGGCDGGYCQLGSFCVSGCVDSHYGTDCKNCSTGCTKCNRLTGTGICEETSGNNVGLFIGLAAAGVLFIVILFLVVGCYKYFQHLKKNRCQYLIPTHGIHMSTEDTDARVYDFIDEAEMYDPLTDDRQTSLSRDLELSETAEPGTTTNDLLV
ncbi:cell death abnormality protein 1-like isoform X2 [Haliotis rufescens]|nr:cell death abnormality protein 1-like isoform X2 [Haliotis rufescens]